MGARGALVLGFFGAMWAELTLVLQWHVDGAWLVLPLLPFGAIAALALLAMSRPGTLVPPERVARAIMWSSIAEGVAIAVGANILVDVGQAAFMLPMIALVVGLHFVPIAIVSGRRGFWGAAAVLVAAALLGGTLPQPLGGAVTGCIAAVALWTASVDALRRDHRARQASGSASMITAAKA